MNPQYTINHLGQGGYYDPNTGEFIVMPIQDYNAMVQNTAPVGNPYTNNPNIQPLPNPDPNKPLNIQTLPNQPLNERLNIIPLGKDYSYNNQPLGGNVGLAPPIQDVPVTTPPAPITQPPAPTTTPPVPQSGPTMPVTTQDYQGQQNNNAPGYMQNWTMQNGQMGFIDPLGRFIPAPAVDMAGNPMMQTQQGILQAQPKQQFNTYNAPVSSIPGIQGMPQNGMPSIGNTPYTQPQQEEYVGDIQNAFNNSSTIPGATGTVTQEELLASKQQGLSQNQKMGLVSGGVGMFSNALKGLSPDQWDPRVGAEKPGFGQLADTKFTQMGATFGPVGMGVGFAVDAVKNIWGYTKKKAQYDVAYNKANFMDQKDSMRTGMQPDYTGLAKYGMLVKSPYLEMQNGGEAKIKLLTRI